MLRQDFLRQLGRLKIHDWLVLASPIGAYLFYQCEGIAPAYKEMLIDFMFVLQHLGAKVLAVDELDDIQQAIDDTLADMEAMCPAFFTGPITRTQLHYFTLQVHDVYLYV